MQCSIVPSVCVFVTLQYSAKTAKQGRHCIKTTNKNDTASAEAASFLFLQIVKMFTIFQIVGIVPGC